MPKGFINLRKRVIEKDETIVDDSDSVELKQSQLQSTEKILTDPSCSIHSKIIDKLESNSTAKMAEGLNVNLMLKIIPSFNGDANIFHKFCTCAEIVWDPLKKGDDKQLFLRVIKSKLCDQAYEVVRYTEFENWDDLKVALEKKFIQRRSQGTVSSKLVQINQLKNENVRSFADKIEKLLNELNEICIEKQGVKSADVIYALNESTALNSFQNGLIEPLRTIVKANNFNNLSEAIERALDEEITHKPNNLFCSFCKNSSHSSKNCYKNKSIVSGNSNSSSKVSSANNSEKTLETTSDNSDNGQKKFCNYCKKRGHLVKDCFKLENNKSKKSTTPNSAEIHSIEQNGKKIETLSINNNSNKNVSGNLERSEQVHLLSVRIDQL